MFHAVGPSRIIFVRHGQREDHADPNWHITSNRPHDAPLTIVGKQAAFELGRYLGERGVVPSYITRPEVAMTTGTATPLKSSTCQPTKEGSASTNELCELTSSTRAPLGVKRQRDANEEGTEVRQVPIVCGNIVVLASPLVRAVQTAHHLICGIMAAARHREVTRMKTETASVSNGHTETPPLSQSDQGAYVPSVEGFADAVQPSSVLFEHGNDPATASGSAAGPSVPKSIPIYIEPGVMECAYWMNYDIAKARDVRAHSGVHEPIPPLSSAGTQWLRRLASAACGVEDNNTSINPIFMPPSYHKTSVSEFVQSTPFPLSDGGIFGFSEVEYTFDTSTGKVIEMDVGGVNGVPCRRGNDTQLRCYNTSAAIANCEALHDKIVIVVGHGQTVRDASQKLIPKVFMADRPKYTAFTDTVRNHSTEVQFTASSPASPNRNTDESPSTPTVAAYTPPHPPPAIAVNTLSPMCLFALREGSEAFGVPHLPLSLLREY